MTNNNNAATSNEYSYNINIEGFKSPFTSNFVPNATNYNN